jgi:hypothetical protein
MGVRVSFLERRAPAASAAPKGVMVPAAAIAKRDGQEVVFTVVDAAAKRNDIVATAPPSGDLRLVTSGLVAGDTVILAPPASLADGSAVTPAKTTP